MQGEDPQNIWAEYYERKKAQRLEEASCLSSQMFAAGVTSDTVLALDFTHFGTSLTNVQALAAQLSENYEMQVASGKEQGIWLANGTTRPNGITLEHAQHLAWVEFMSDVAQSHACVFSTWSLEAPSLGVRFNSEHAPSAT
jgi:hypothetical protein